MRIVSSLLSIKQKKNVIYLETDAMPFRILFLTDDILRIRAGFDGTFREASYALTLTAWEDAMDEVLGKERTRVEPADFRMKKDDSGQCTVIEGARLRVTIDHEPFVIRVYDRESQALLHEDIPSMGWLCDRNGRRIHRSVMQKSEHYYGFGERTGHLDKRGRFLKNGAGDTLGYDPAQTDPLYKNIPFYISVNEDTREAAGFFYHNTWEGDFDLGRSHSNYVKHHTTYRTDGGDIDLFIIRGPKVRDVIARYTDLTGKSALLPKAALGYLGSSMYYPQLPEHADDAILSFADHAEAEGIPMDGFMLSSGYCEVETKAGEKRCTFTWNSKRFPNPAAFFADMRARRISVSPNIKPGMLLVHPMFDEMMKAGLFIKNASDDTPACGLWWGGSGAYVDFTDKKNRSTWKSYVKEHLLSYGADSIWNDNCEYDGLTDLDARVSLEGMGATAAETKAVMSNLMCKTARDALLEDDPRRRPFVVCRSGFAGIQRYAQTWAGDNFTGWDSLKYNIATILGMGLSGVASQGCDIGGFAGPAPEEELFVRWVQQGIFQPRFSIHSVNSDNTVTEPWMYSESKERIASAIRFRYALSPYLYSLTYRAHVTGLPIMEAFVSAFPEDPSVWQEDVNYMVGDGLLSAPVVEPQAAEKEIHLPAGHVFYDFETRKAHEGGQTVSIPVDLDSIPLFLMDGAIVPVAAEPLANLTAKPARKLHLLCVPKCGSWNENSRNEAEEQENRKDGKTKTGQESNTSVFVYYEDDSTSMDYENGQFSATTLTLTGGATTVLTFEKTGEYPSDVEEMEIDLTCPDRSPLTVTADGEVLPRIPYRPAYEQAESGWYYSATKKSVLIRLPWSMEDHRVEISFEAQDMIRV